MSVTVDCSGSSVLRERERENNFWDQLDVLATELLEPCGSGAEEKHFSLPLHLHGAVP